MSQPRIHSVTCRCRRCEPPVPATHRLANSQWAATVAVVLLVGIGTALLLGAMS